MRDDDWHEVEEMLCYRFRSSWSSSDRADAKQPSPQHTSCASVSNAFHDYFPLGGVSVILVRQEEPSPEYGVYLPTFHHPPISETFSRCFLPRCRPVPVSHQLVRNNSILLICVHRVEFFAELSLCKYIWCARAWFKWEHWHRVVWRNHRIWW